jgi:hypothetical protein
LHCSEVTALPFQSPSERGIPATLDDLAAHDIVTGPLGPSHLIEVFSTRFAPYRKFAVERTS